jgi:hypothetical protein
MRPNLLSAGVSPEKADAFIEGLGGKGDEEIVAYVERLAALKDGAYRDFMKVWGLKTPGWWANMALLGETDLREHKLLKPLAKALRREWRRLNASGKNDDPEQDGEPAEAPAEPDAPAVDPA